MGESVELVKRARKASAAGLVNAVLRKAHRDPVAWPGATETSHPAWLLERWQQQYGAEVAEGIVRANLRTPETYVRSVAGEQSDIKLEPTDVPGCYRLVEGRAEGLRIQDIGSQSIVPLLDLRPGQTFLDLCAAPGDKTAQALESGVRAVACDIHSAGSPDCANWAATVWSSTAHARCRSATPSTVSWWTRPARARARWRATRRSSGGVPEDLVDLHQRQVALLRNALDRLAPGGRLVYSTCSLEHEENEDVVAEVGLQPLHVLRRIPGREPGDGFFAAMITSE